VFAHDPSAVGLLWSGRESGKLTRSSLVRSAERLVSRLFHLWPDEMTSWWARPTGPSPFQQQIGVMP
jgi:hypothetical protein